MNHLTCLRVVKSLILLCCFAGLSLDLLAAPAPYPLVPGEVVMTGFSGSSPNGYSVTVMDVRPPMGQPGVNWLAPMFTHPSWTSANLGEVFGICLDNNNPPNIYVTATIVYNNTSFGPAGSGGVYKLDGNTGAISTFASLPAGTASLGNICFDALHNQFFVSNLDDGLVYRLDMNGAILSTYNHGDDGRPNESLPQISDSGTPGLTAAGRRVWGLQVYNGRLYYGVWIRDGSTTIGSAFNEIWSVGINGDGSFNSIIGPGGAKREINLPSLPNQNWSSPVSDIAFSKTGKMLLGERSAIPSGSTYLGSSHVSRVLEYYMAGSSWVPSGYNYHVGYYTSGDSKYNSDGGVDYDCEGRVYATGEGLLYDTDNSIYSFGLQIIPSQGNTEASRISTSYIIDFDGITSTTDKLAIGDVVFYQENCECLNITNCAPNKVVDCGSDWTFDAPANGGCTNFTSTFTTVTNDSCPTEITRTWTINDAFGNTNTCSQTVTVMPALKFFTPITINSSTIATHQSPFGNGQVKLTLSSGNNGTSWAQTSTPLWSSQFPILFPHANNNWLTPAQSIPISCLGNFVMTIDLTQYNLSPGFVFGLFRLPDESTSAIATFDANNVQINPNSPFTWNFIGNDHDALHPMGGTSLSMDPTTGDISTHQFEFPSDAAFWNNIPAGTKKIVITSTLAPRNPGTGTHYVFLYFAESAQPIVTCSSNKTVECGTNWDFDGPIIDGCSGTNGMLTILSTQTNSAAGDCNTVITRTWQTVDTCNNTNTCSQTVTVADTTPPEIVCAGDKTINCSEDWSFDFPTATDQCGDVAITVLSTVTNAANSSIITRTWMATDACSNTVSCSQTVTLNTSGLTITCPPSIITNITGNSSIVTFDEPLVTGGAIQSCFPASGSVFQLGATIVNCTATNECSTNVCTFTVNVSNCENFGPNLVENGSFETTSPVLNPNASSNTLDPFTGVPGWTTSENFLEVWANTVQSIPASVGLNQLEINAQSIDQTVTQVITNLSTNCETMFCFDYTGRFGLVGSAAGPSSPNNDFTVTLSSGGIVFSLDLNPSQYAAGGWISFCTNFIPASSTVTISFRGKPHAADGSIASQGGAHIDNVSLTQCCPPDTCLDLDCAPDKTVECGAIWDFDAPTNSAEECDLILSFSTVTNGTCPVEITRTWIITDALGNSNTCSQTVTVADTTPPEIACAGDKTINCSEDWRFDFPTATDQCGDVAITVLSTVTNAANSSIITRTWVATDSCSNTVSCSQTVTLNAATPPSITCPRDILVTVCESSAVVTFAEPVVTNGVLQSCLPASGSVFPVGVTTVTCIATNACSTNSCTFNVTVRQSSEVTITCPPSIITNITGNSSIVTFDDPIVTGGAIQSCFPASGSVFPLGTTMVTCTATNDCSTNVCTFAVTVSNCENFGTNFVLNGSFETTSPVLGPGSFSNTLDPFTGVPGWTTSENSLEVWANTVQGIPASVGLNQLEINAQSIDQTVTQVITNLSTNCETMFCFDYTGRFGLVGSAGGSSSPNNDFTVTLTSGAVVFSLDLNPAQFASGGWVTFCTNFIPASSTVTISFRGKPHAADGSIASQGGAHIDNVSLTQCCSTDTCLDLVCAPDKTVECGTIWDFDAPTNNAAECGLRLTFSTVTNGTCPVEITRTWVVTDALGNSNTCSQTVTVIDTTAPRVTCADNKGVECGSVWRFDPPTGFDTCSGTNLTVTIAGTVTNLTPVACQTEVIRIWNIADACGNTTTCTQRVMVVDTTAPSLTCASDKTVQCGSLWTFDSPSSVDACSGTNVSIIVLSTQTNSGCPMVITRTWQATDSCGRTNICSQRVTVVDTTPPVLVCATNKTVNCNQVWTFDPPTVMDACSGTNVTLTILSTQSSGSCTQVFRRTWQATDSCSNSIICVQSVTVVNTNLPMVQCSSNLLVMSCVATQVFYSATAWDACNSNLTAQCSPPSGSTFQPGTTNTVICRASNCNGTATCSFTVTVLCPTNTCVPCLEDDCVQAPPNMVLWLPFDETSGTSSRNLAGANNGIRVNGPVVISGYVANSLRFNGVNQYVQVPTYNAINFGTNDFSIDAWIKRATNNPSGNVWIIVDKRAETFSNVRGYSFFLTGAGLLAFQLADGTHLNYTSSLTVPNDDQWHHVAVTVDRDSTTGIKFYLNGSQGGLMHNPTVRPGSVSTGNPLRVGSRTSSVSFTFPGSIDEVELFNRVLDPGEIESLYNAGAAGKCKCVSITNKTLECLGTNGTYSWTFDLVNQSTNIIEFVSFSDLPPGVTINHNPLLLDPPLSPGEALSIGLAITNLSGLSNVCFTVNAHTPDFKQVCAITNCLVFETCCADVLSETLVAIPGQPNCYNYSFTFRNVSATEIISYIFLVPDPLTGCLSFTPNMIQLAAPLHPGQVSPTIGPIKVCVNTLCPPPRRFFISLNNAQLHECCSIKHSLPALPTIIDIIGPIDGAVLFSTTNILLNVAIDGPIVFSEVTYVSGDKAIASTTMSPFSQTWSNAEPGEYVLRAAGTEDASGGIWYSDAITVYVIDPEDNGLIEDSRLEGQMSNAQFTFRMNTVAGVTYSVETTDSLTNEWEVLEVFVGDGAARTTSPPRSISTQRFYRVRIEVSP